MNSMDTREGAALLADAPEPGPSPVPPLADAEAALQRAEFQRAAAAARSRLVRDPNDLGALLVLGDATIEMECFEEAKGAFRRALDLAPDNLRALNGLAAAALASRDPQTALAHAKRAWTLAPASVDSYLALAPAAICMQDEPTIEACYAFLARADRAVSTRLQRFWAQSLAYLDKFDYAAGMFEPLARAAPNDAERLLTLANYLLRAHRLDDAKACIDAFVALAPAAPEAHDLLAEWATQKGDLGLSRSAARRAIALNPNLASAYLTLARNDPADITEVETATLASILHGKNFSVPWRFTAGLALGLALESRRDHDGAFAAFSMANKLAHAAAQSAGAGYDRIATEAQVASTKRAFPRESLNKPVAASDRGGEFIFVLGMPRSGTTLVDQILASHSRVESVGENSGMTRLFETFLDRTCSGDEAVAILARHADEWRQLYRRTLATTQGRAEFIVDKMILNFWSIGLIARLFPDAKIILLRRDPMDVCLSIFRLNFLKSYAFSNDLEETAHYYRCFEDLCAHWQTALPQKIKVVEYETLLEDFEAQVAAVLAHCGLQMEPGCLAFHENKRPVFTLSAAQVRKGINRSARGRWRRYEKYLGPLKAALGVSQGD